MAVITRLVAPEGETNDITADATGALPRRRRWLRRLVRAAVLYVLACVGVVALSALFAYQGIAELRAVRRDAGPADLVDGSAADRLAGASDDLDWAAALIGGPWMAPLRIVPGVGRQVDALQAMVVGSADLTDAAADGMTDAHDLVGAGVPTGQ